MATMNFPTSPAVNDTYSFGGSTWQWNGTGWKQLPNSALPTQTGNSGKYLSTNGTVASWATVAAGGASFAVGTVLPAMTAPSDGGTWLECNGQVVSQATYPALYSAIGHDYMRYKITRLPNIPTGMLAASYIVCTGTVWMCFTASSTAVSKSLDEGVTWTSVTALPASASAYFIVTNRAGGVMVCNGTNQTVYVSLNDGASWTTSSIFIQPNVNTSFQWVGSTIIGVNPGTASASLTRSVNNGTSWNQPSLAAASGSTPILTWTGTNWVILSLGGTNSTTTTRHITADATGDTGWSVSYPNLGLNMSNIGTKYDFIVGSGVIATSNNGAYVGVSTDAGNTTAYRVSSHYPMNNNIIWTGKHFIQFQSLAAPILLTITSDGKAYASNLDVDSSVEFNGNLGIVEASPQNNKNGRVNFNTNTIVCTIRQSIGIGGTTTAPFLIQLYPSVNPATQFNVPQSNYGGLGALTKSWIKAA